jgi:hypothetical protein
MVEKMSEDSSFTLYRDTYFSGDKRQCRVVLRQQETRWHDLQHKRGNQKQNT